MATGVPAVSVGDPNKITLLDLRRDVSRYIQGGDDPEILDAARSAINNGIARLNLFGWKWNLKTQTVPSDARTADYAILDSVREPRHLSILGTDGFELGKLGFQAPGEFKDIYAANTEGSPEAYTIFSRHNFGTLSLSHRPTTAWVALHPNMLFWYFAYVPELNGPGDVLNAPSEYRPLVYWYACYQLSMVHGEPSAADRAERAWRETEQRLKASDNREGSDWHYDSPFEVGAV